MFQVLILTIHTYVGGPLLLSNHCRTVLNLCGQHSYQATLDAGADPVTVTNWINTTTAERAEAERELANASRLERLTREEISTIVDELGNLSAVVRTADPKSKADLYGRMGLRLTYRPDTRKVEAQIKPGLHHMCQRLVSEGGLDSYVHAADAVRGPVAGWMVTGDGFFSLVPLDDHRRLLHDVAEPSTTAVRAVCCCRVC